MIYSRCALLITEITAKMTLIPKFSIFNVNSLAKYDENLKIKIYDLTQYIEANILVTSNL